MLTEFNTCKLCQAEIAAFTDDLAAQAVCINSYAVIRMVTDVAVPLVAGLDVRADATVPEQIEFHAQDGSNQLVRLHRHFACTKHSSCLGAKSNRLGLSRVNSATFRDDAVIVVVPTGSSQVEQALPFLEARANIGIGIQEDVHVIERCKQAYLA